MVNAEVRWVYNANPRKCVALSCNALVIFKGIRGSALVTFLTFTRKRTCILARILTRILVASSTFKSAKDGIARTHGFLITIEKKKKVTKDPSPENFGQFCP